MLPRWSATKWWEASWTATPTIDCEETTPTWAVAPPSSFTMTTTTPSGLITLLIATVNSKIRCKTARKVPSPRLNSRPQDTKARRTQLKPTRIFDFPWELQVSRRLSGVPGARWATFQRLGLSSPTATTNKGGGQEVKELVLGRNAQFLWTWPTVLEVDCRCVVQRPSKRMLDSKNNFSHNCHIGSVTLGFPGKLCQHQQPSPHPCWKPPFWRGGGKDKECQTEEEPLVLGCLDLSWFDPACPAHHWDHLCSRPFVWLNQLFCGRQTQWWCRWTI